MLVVVLRRVEVCDCFGMILCLCRVAYVRSTYCLLIRYLCVYCACCVCVVLLSSHKGISIVSCQISVRVGVLVLGIFTFTFVSFACLSYRLIYTCGLDLPQVFSRLRPSQ